MNLVLVDDIIARYRWEKAAIIAILQDIQREFNYLPQEALTYAASRLAIPLTQVYSLATFYRAFSLKPRGKHLITVCLGTACHVRGAVRILEKLERELGIKAGETTDDMRVSLETVNCLGACALGPIVVIDGQYHGQMTSVKTDSILKKLRKL
ncbi:MAG: NAD(P)H-dependent oxidoreductase subunit E [Candidatus Latescibacteria bacterium]|nr:NAD(P)H-dependent oxidoreductase subunit E [Candidatus Latescibacterota bacterium]